MPAGLRVCALDADSTEVFALTSHLSYLITMTTITQIRRPRMENDPKTVATVTTILRSESST